MYENKHEKDVVEFCEDNNILYIPIRLKISEKNVEGVVKREKQLLPDDIGYPKQTDFDKQPDLIQKRVSLFKKHPEKYTHIAIDTRFIHQIDIDCEEVDER